MTNVAMGNFPKAYDYIPKPCIICGGPKPKGKGIRVCSDICREKWRQQKTERYRPGSRIRSEKRNNAKKLPCKVCGGPKPKQRGARVCSDECRVILKSKEIDKTKIRNRISAEEQRRLQGRPKKEPIPKAPPGKRWCPRCKRFRAESFFTKTVDRWMSGCNQCRRKYAHDARVVRVYGITPEEYQAIYEAQGGKCYICQRATGESKRLAVDHNHESGEVRGLLCSLCNYKVIGHLREDIAALQRAIEFLQNPPARAVLKKMRSDNVKAS